jgi:hypothetical protein
MFKTIKTPEQIAAEAAEAAREKRIAELKKYLRETDYVTLPDYGKDKPDIIAQRQAARDEIRELEE